ncbi:MAG: nucleotide sugar dehydrogenase [Deltaproteobacteria bacterium]|nr:nucleotide sugar dehydrogenase [Deltaproteobacteria bacterium]
MQERVGVIGLGYVGLPVALAFADRFEGTVGFDIRQGRVEALRAGHDATAEVEKERLLSTSLRVTADPADLAGVTFFVVTVPTPIDDSKRPDLTAMIKASETVGRVLKPGAVVVYESTVYPGVTEEVCGPVLERISGLRCGVDFTLGYSPERINPGDREHTLERIVKVVSGQDAATLDRVAAAYGAIVTAGVHRAPTIKVAEAAKVIENTQRDLNIALMNELAMIFDRLGINTRDVLDAAGTKWNFLKFSPGLVGGHCIGVDPYYLTAKAESVGFRPDTILAGRRINDGMGAFIATKMVKLLLASGRDGSSLRVGVLGLTFKEDVPDIRNSRVPDILNELREFGIEPIIHDPHAEADEVAHEYGLTLSALDAFSGLDALVLAVSHREYREMASTSLFGMLKAGGLLVDVKSCIPRSSVPEGIGYWSL